MKIDKAMAAKLGKWFKEALNTHAADISLEMKPRDDGWLELGAAIFLKAEGDNAKMRVMFYAVDPSPEAVKFTEYWAEYYES
jgi:hypothetical protein